MVAFLSNQAYTCAVFLAQKDAELEKTVECYDPQLLAMKDIRAIVRVQKLFCLAVVWRWSLPPIRKMVRWPLDRLYHLVFLLTFAYRYMRSNQLSPLHMVRFARHSLVHYRHKGAE